MRIQFSLPRWSVGLMAMFFVMWGGGTVVLFVKHQNAQRAWNYKTLYMELNQSHAELARKSQKEDLKISLKGLSFPNKVLRSLDTSDITEKRVELTQSFSVYVLFSKLDCSACIRRELYLWQEFHEKHSDRADVIGIARTLEPEEVLKTTRSFVTFPTYWDQEKAITNTLHITHTPAIVLVDNQTQKIMDVHFGEVGEDEASEAFRSSVMKKLAVATDVAFVGKVDALNNE